VSTIVGIFPDGATVQSVVDGLKQSGEDVGRLHVLACDELPTELAESGVHCVWIGDVEREIDAHGFIGDNSSRVPGLTGASASSIGVGGDELMECLADLNVPDGRTDDYARAVEEGRLVVGFAAPSDPEKMRQLFSSSGAAIVESF
jgi:hypothetical protein